MIRAATLRRAREYAALVRGGATLVEIGRQRGVSRQAIFDTLSRAGLSVAVLQGTPPRPARRRVRCARCGVALRNFRRPGDTRAYYCFDRGECRRAYRAQYRERPGKREVARAATRRWYWRGKGFEGAPPAEPQRCWYCREALATFRVGVVVRFCTRSECRRAAARYQYYERARAARTAAAAA